MSAFGWQLMGGRLMAAPGVGGPRILGHSEGLRLSGQGAFLQPCSAPAHPSSGTTHSAPPPSPTAPTAPLLSSTPLHSTPRRVAGLDPGGGGAERRQRLRLRDLRRQDGCHPPAAPARAAAAAVPLAAALCLRHGGECLVRKSGGWVGLAEGLFCCIPIRSRTRGYPGWKLVRS